MFNFLALKKLKTTKILFLKLQKTNVALQFCNSSLKSDFKTSKSKNSKVIIGGDKHSGTRCTFVPTRLLKKKEKENTILNIWPLYQY